MMEVEMNTIPISTYCAINSSWICSSSSIFQQHDNPNSSKSIQSNNYTSKTIAKDTGNRKNGKSTYKHIPHREKPAHLVARRNARERRRVQAVNTAFAKLRKCVQTENPNKRLSKVKTLQKAIEYINRLQQLLDSDDQHPAQAQEYSSAHFTGNINKENIGSKYTTYEQSHEYEPSLESYYGCHSDTYSSIN